MQFGSAVLFVSDVPAVLDFYNRAFGFVTKFYDPSFGFGMLDAGGVEVGVSSHESGERMMPGGYRRPTTGNPEGVELAFYTEDVSAAYQRALDAGADGLAAPYVTSWGQTVAYVLALEGTVIGICAPLAG